MMKPFKFNYVLAVMWIIASQATSNPWLISAFVFMICLHVSAMGFDFAKEREA